TGRSASRRPRCSSRRPCLACTRSLMSSLSFQNPADDLRAEENELSLGRCPKMRQALNKILLTDGPRKASENLRRFHDGERFAKEFLAGVRPKLRSDL